MKEARDAREGAMEGRWGCAPHWRDRLLAPDVLGGAASRLIIRLAARGTTDRRLNACAPRREPTAASQLCGRIFPGARAGALDESRGARAHPRASLGPITKIYKSLASVTHYCPSGPVGLTRSSFRSYQNMT